MSLLFATKTQAGQQTVASGLNLQSSCYGKAVPVIYGYTRVPCNILWYNDFKAIPQQSSPSHGGGKGGVGGGGGGKGGGGSVTYNYYTSAIFAVGEGAIGGITNVYVDKNVVSPASLSMSIFNGSYSQTPWGYLSTKHPSNALNYHGIAYTAVSDYNLGNSAQLPNHNFEVNGLISGQATNGKDADASLVITDILTNAKYGMNFSSYASNGISYDFSNYQKYVRAFDFGISPAFIEQRPCAEALNEIVKNTNSEFVWSGGVLTIVPYGDLSKTANGCTYTAPSSPLYNLTDDDFLPNASGGAPVTLTRKRGSDVINSIKLECLDRNNSYNPATIEVKDQLLIDNYGLRQDSSRAAHLFCDTTTAKNSAQLQLYREQVRNTYTFKTSQRYILLDPMDIISITDSYLGINNQWVRIKTIVEDESRNLVFTCEEYMGGNGNSPTYSLQTSSGFSANYNNTPGNVNTPVIFEAPVQIATTGLEIWMAVSGGANWGGCDVYISSDGSTYKLAGRITGSARQGVLTSTFASGSDPDTTNTCSVDLSSSYGQLLSGTQSDADLSHTLCYVDGEFVSYQTATLTSAYNYTLGTYIRRGQYGSTISSHASGSTFARLDDGIFKYTYVKEQIGQKFYAKFLSFNIYGGGEQSLAEVSPFTRVIQGPPPPPNVKNFSVQQNGNTVVFVWDDVSDFALRGYDILYSPQGGSINNAVFLTEALRGTEMTNASVPPGSWTFYIRGVDIAGQYSPTPTTFNLNVTNANSVISQVQQETAWLGTKNNLYLHYTGVLIPLGTKTCDQYTRVSMPSAPSLYSVVGGSLGSTTYYVVITYTTATGETLASNESTITIAAGSLLAVTSPAVSGNASGWNIYAGTSTGSKTKQNLAQQSIGNDWTLPTTGLISGGALPTYNSTGWDVFDNFCPDPVATASYITPTIDTSFDDTLRISSTVSSNFGSGQAGIANIQYAIDTWLTAGSDTGVFFNWTIGYALMRYIKHRITLTLTAGSVFYITGFTPTVDKSLVTESGTNITIGSSGTAITFPNPYHSAPQVQVTALAGSALIATASSLTATGFIAHVFNTSGTEVGGIINWTAVGT